MGSNKCLRADLTWSSKNPQLQERKVREMGRKNVLLTADADPLPALPQTLLHARSLFCRLLRTRGTDACAGGGTSLRPGL